MRTAERPVRQVGYLDDVGACGPICDCASCGAEPVCGLEPACGVEPGYGYEPGCGIEPGCGLEPGCGIEPGCGFEVTCGVEGPCGLPGCDSCGHGVVAGHPGWVEPSCGCEGACDGSCDAAYCHVESFPLLVPILYVDWSRFEFFAGTQGFQGPMNFARTGAAGQPRAGSGSFGFHQGFNEGRSLRHWFGVDLAAQFGLRATQTHLEGTEFSPENRRQIFLTSGLFRRVDYGLQYGVVVDYLNEDWYYQADLVQLRGELSWKFSACHEFGFRFMAGVNDDTILATTTTPAFSETRAVEAADQYRGFYRRSFGRGGSWTAFVGGTDHEHFIIGSQTEIPLAQCWSFAAGSTYFSPSDDVTLDATEAEGWNVSLGVIFRPGMGVAKNRYRRPLFNVADNGSFLVHPQ